MSSPMAWHTLSGFRRDRSVARRKLAPGTVRRIVRFASPYKRWLGVFLALILVDAVITVVNPLILKQIIDEGVAPDDPRAMDAVEQHRLQIDRWFYPCSPEMHVGLGEMYVADPRFAATYEQFRPGMAQYVCDAIVANAARAQG